MFGLKKSLTIILSLLTAVSLSFSGCAGGSGNQQTSSNPPKPQNKQLTIAVTSDAQLIDPGYAESATDGNICYYIFDGLVKFKNDTSLDVEPALATSWNMSEDGKTWTFQLRKDVKFQDGTKFDANAVVQSVERLIDKKNKYYGQVQGGYSYLQYLMGDVLDSVSAQGESTVIFRLKQKFAPFLTYMGYYSEFIVSPAALDQFGGNFPSHPVGTGPYKLLNWKKGEYIELEANPDYWGEKPKVQKLIFKIVPDASTRLMELQSGQVDAITSLSPEQIQSVQTNKDLTVKTVEGASLFYASINTTKAPFNNVKVRQALNEAINIPAIVKSVYAENGTRAVNALPSTVFSFDKTVGPYPYDPEKAKELLKEAGYPNGFKMSIYTFDQARPYISDPVQVAQLIQADLKKVGIQANVVTNEWATHSTLMSDYKFDIALTGWYDIPYPSNFLKSMVLEGSNTGYAPKELEAIANNALATYDTKAQESYYQDLQKKIYDAAPIIPIAYSNYNIAYRSNITGLGLDILGAIRAQTADRP